MAYEWPAKFDPNMRLSYYLSDGEISYYEKLSPKPVEELKAGGG